MRDNQQLGCILFALFAGYLLHKIDAASLVINPSGQTQNQPAGKGFGLTCQGEAENVNLFTQMKWRGPKGDLTEGTSGPVEVSSLGSRLILMFKSPTTDDSGMYNCTAVYDNIDQLSTAVNLIFYQDITWEDCPEQQALVINSDGKITCRVSANPPAMITWTRDGQSLGERYETKTDGVLVSGVIEADKGEFLVRAMVSQTGRFQNRLIKVEVHVPPEIIELEDKAEAIEGNEAMLNCKASGFPRPLYSWYDKDQRDLSSVEGYTVDADTGTLTFHSVKQQDEGSYACKAKNPAGEAERSLDFTVIVKPEIKTFNNITAVENEDATFECHAYGNPLPEINIQKDGMDAFTADNDRIELSRREEEGKAILTLKIQEISRSDDGLYYCTADNKGAQVSKVGHLTVEFAPVLSSTPSILVKTWNGKPANLTCIAESIPNATISWSYGGIEITDDDIYTINGRSAYSTLVVKPPPNNNRGGRNVYGNYRCDATNPHGSQHINIELYEAKAPSRILEVLTEKETPTTLTFKFLGPQDDGGLTIRAFAVKYYEEGQGPDQEDMLHEWSEGTPYVLAKLKPRTAYRFQFAARNDVGLGEWGEEKRIVMPEESAPEPPKFIIPGGNNVSTYPDRFQLRWTEPLDNGREIDFFELRYFETEHRDNTWKRLGEVVVHKLTHWKPSPMFEMKNLKSNTHYKVEVRAHNDLGYSMDATMVFQTAAGSGHDGHPNGYHSGSSGSLSYGAIAAIIIVLILVILLVLDVTCYVRYEWGMLYMLRNRVCAKPMNDKAKEAAAEEGKAGKGERLEEKSRTEVDNPAFDKEKELLRLSKEDNEKDNEGDVATEDTPMIQTSGAKDTRPNDADVEVKNKSPKGSKSSIAKDSLV